MSQGWRVPVPPREGAGGAGLDAGEARRALALFAGASPLVNLRGLVPGGGPARNVILPSADLAGLLRVADEWTRQGRNAYLVLNPLVPDCKRPANKGPLVEHVARRRWLFVDIDPVKPEAHAKDSATDREKELARSVMHTARAALDAAGWPAPVVVDSGNGFYLLYAIDVPNDDAGRVLVKGVLEALARRFNSPAGRIDSQCHDANRIAKLPGTLARKGAHAADRPHRPCRLLEVPDPLEVVPDELLVEMAGVQSVEPPVTPEPTPAPSANGWHVPASPGPSVEERAVAYLRSCPPAVQGEKGSNVTLYVARAMVWGFKLPPGTALRLILDTYNPTCRPPWTEKELAHKVDDAGKPGFGKPEGWLLNEKHPRFRASDYYAPSKEARDPEKAKAAREEARQGGRGPEVVTLRDLMGMVIPEPRWAVPGILCEGLNILAGKPKLGKSFFALNLAITIAAGGKALGDVQTEPGDVLYLSLEDRKRRLQARARKILPGLGLEASARLHLATHWPRQDADGLGYVEDWIEAQMHPSLVVIDVWARFRTPMRNGGSQYEQDYAAAAQVKEVADRHGVSMLILHHCKKAAAEDALDEISGTLGLAGCADGALVLTRARKEDEANLFMTGRDIQEGAIALAFDPVTCCWKSLGPAEARVEGRLQQGALQYLQSLNGQSAFVADIAAHMNVSPDKVRPVLHRLFDRRLVRRVGKAWAHPGDDPPPGADSPFE